MDNYSDFHKIYFCLTMDKYLFPAHSQLRILLVCEVIRQLAD
jgi:hypothetical protein